MAKISVINSTFIRGEQRLDAEHYEPNFLSIIETLHKLQTKLPILPLSSEKITRKFIKSMIIGDRIAHYGKRGIPFIRVSDIKDLSIDTSKITFLTHTKGLTGLAKAKPHDIVISKSGTIASVGVIPEDYSGWYLSDDLICLRTNINPYYLATFLECKYGKAQILRGRTQQVQMKVSIENLKKVLIPVLPKDFQLHIEQLVQQAHEKRKLAEQKYQQAEELLYELLGISKEEIERLEAEKVYEVNFKEVKQAFRFDAEYYHPKYHFSDKIFKQISSARLGSKEYFELKKGIEVGSDAYCDKNRGVLFLRVSNLSRDGLKLNPSDKYVFKGIYKKLRPKYEPKEGEVLFSKDGTIGTATVVDSDFPPSIISGGVVRIRIKKDFDPYYLAFVLNSILLELQVTREKTGTVIEHLRFSKLKEIRVPKLPLSQQQYVANLVREYFKLRKEARQLVQRAIREVEEAIENASSSNGE